MSSSRDIERCWTDGGGQMPITLNRNIRLSIFLARHRIEWTWFWWTIWKGVWIAFTATPAHGERIGKCGGGLVGWVAASSRDSLPFYFLFSHLTISYMEGGRTSHYQWVWLFYIVTRANTTWMDQKGFPFSLLDVGYNVEQNAWKWIGYWMMKPTKSNLFGRTALLVPCRL